MPPGHVSFEPVIGEDPTRATAHLGPGSLGKAQPAMVVERRERKQSDACLAYVDAQVTGPFRIYRHEVEVLPVRGGVELRESIEYELPAGGARAEKTLKPRIDALLRFREEQLHGDLALIDHPSHASGKRIAIAGASGLIGTQVAALLEAAGHDVVRLARPSSSSGGPSIPWDPHAGELEPEALAGVEAVVNLAGRSIGTRMTAKAKHEILASRVTSSQLLARTVAELSRAGEGPSVVVQASAVGYYGAKRPGEILGEDSAPGGDVLAQVCKAWEACLEEAREANVRTVALRTGIGPE